MTNTELYSLGQYIETLFDDLSFQKLLKRFSQKCICWDEFLSLNLPPNISPLGMWEIMNRMSRCMGIVLPIPDLNDCEYWYRRTHELTDIIGIVTRACALDAHLHRTITAADSQHFLMNVRISDAIAATRLDGLLLSDRDADIQLRLDRAPHNTTEQLLANTFNAIKHLPDLVGESFSRDLFVHLRDRLLDGVDIGALETTRASLGTGLFEWPDAMTERFADRQMEYIAAYANHETGEYDHDVLRALILTDSFRFYRPLRKVSYQVGRLVAHLYALKHDLPMLGLLPISRVKLDWDEGRILPPQVAFDRTAYENMRIRAPGDLTSLQTLTAQLTLFALRIVEHYVEGWENRDRALRKILKKDLQLNDRQRSILARALRKPESEFTIRYHKNNHGIAYPTARRDFLELVGKGYLTQQQRGKSFIFKPHYELCEMIYQSGNNAPV